MNCLYKRATACLLMIHAFSSGCSAEDEVREPDSTSSNVNPATDAVAVLRKNLDSLDLHGSVPFDRRIIVGHQETNVSNRATQQPGLSPVDSDFAKLVGSSPALVGYELAMAHYGSLMPFDADTFRQGSPALRARIIEQNRNGALVSLVWHIRCPRENTSDSFLFSPSDCPSYTLESLLASSTGQSGSHFIEWRQMLDAIGEFLLSLKDANGVLIPVQFRPFHEFNGNWFWWGKNNKSSDFKAVYRELVNYLRKKGVNNILWVFSPGDPSDDPTVFTEYYPGDDVVDVVAFDRYDAKDGSFADRFAADLRVTHEFAKDRKKIAAIAEVGSKLDDGQPSPIWFTNLLGMISDSNAKIAYFSLWRNSKGDKYVPLPEDGIIATNFSAMARDRVVRLAGENNLYLPLR